MIREAQRRTGATRRDAIPRHVLRALNAGKIETVTLAEWLAVDFQTLLRHFAREVGCLSVLPSDLLSREFVAFGVTRRLSLIGKFISEISSVDPAVHERASCHRSDIVRQWAAYAVANQESMTLADRLRATLPYAQDPNMTVREVAWMTFRPYLAADLALGLKLLLPLTTHEDFRVRRFAIEVSRPRSVWGTHIRPLKADPRLGLPLLQNVRDDKSKYVQDAVGNWLNDASKSTAEAVLRLASNWARSATEPRRRILRRALRTLLKSDRHGAAAASILQRSKKL